MLDVLQAHIAAKPPSHQLHALREYLQWLALQALDDAGFRRNLAFTGGTCLRVVFGINRFSEDLDFSLVQKKGFDMAAFREALVRRMLLLGLKADASPLKEGNAVGSFFVRFGGLLQPLGLSPMKSEKLGIKIEVDTRPPAGATIQEYLFQDPILFMISHFDLPSLFATKLHALLFRGFDKGRDYYDLFYFLRKKVEPSLPLFQSAARQTHPERAFPDRNALMAALRAKVEGMDEKKILRDVGPFLLDPQEAKFLRKDFLLKSLDQAFPQSA